MLLHALLFCLKNGNTFKIVILYLIPTKRYVSNLDTEYVKSTNSNHYIFTEIIKHYLIVIKFKI